MYTIALLAVLQSVQVPTFAAKAQMVSLTVSAFDERTGKPVTDLKPDDLMILEDGKRQNIKRFASDAVPASVVILLDTSISMRLMRPAIREAAANLIRSLRPDDEVQVATFDTRYRILADFTADREEALRSLATMTEGPDTALNTALYRASRFLELRHQEELNRRRIIILLSDGENTYGMTSVEDTDQSYRSTEDALRRSTVACYVVHIHRSGFAGSDGMALSEHAARFVQSIVYETGGRLITVEDPYRRQEIVHAFSDIAEELGSQYHLGYASAGATGWHSIGVVLTSRAGVRLRFRRAYYSGGQR